MTGVLEGVTRFPPEFAARYREKGYWQNRPLFDGLRDGLRRYADRVAIIDVEWDELGYEQSVMDLVFHANAERVLGI
jgi:non-ribosomal peptide synthetase component E (peptide arylation enzyme)